LIFLFASVVLLQKALVLAAAAPRFAKIYPASCLEILSSGLGFAVTTAARCGLAGFYRDGELARGSVS
jgi:hypothetical protein